MSKFVDELSAFLWVSEGEQRTLLPRTLDKKLHECLLMRIHIATKRQQLETGSHLVSSLAQHYRHFQLFLASEDRYLYSVPGAVFVHDLGEDLLALNLLSVDGDD